MTAIMSDTLSASSFNSDPMAWFRARQRQVLIVGGLVLGVGAVGGFMYWTQIKKEAAAADLLEHARNSAEGPNGLAVASSELQRIMDQFKGTKAAQEAVLTLAQIRVLNGQNQLAVVALQGFVDGSPRAEFAAPAHGLLGAALEGNSRPAEAAENYMAAYRAAELDPLKAQYLIHAARAYRNAGQTEPALAALRIVIKDFKNTPFNTEATVRLAEMTKGAEPVATH